MSAAVYSTIWLSLILLVAGETGKRLVRADHSVKWPWRVWAIGVALCAVHMGLAIAVRHGWDHQAAVAAAAQQAVAVYGFSWRGALYLNYLFLVVWGVETVWWARSPRRYLSCTSPVVWSLRAFYFVIILNAVVIFARPVMRPAGMLLIAVLAAAWLRGSEKQGRGFSPSPRQ